MATAVTPVPQESVSFSTPLSYVRTLNLESEIISTKFTLTPSFLNTELFLISLPFCVISIFSKSLTILT